MEAMPLRDMLFWFFITIFGTGTFVIFEQHVNWGTALIVIGLIGIVSCAWPSFKSQQMFAHFLNSRPLLTVVFLVFSLCLLRVIATPDFIMHLHQRLRGWFGFAVVGLVGATLSCGFWWLTGKMLASTPTSQTNVYIPTPEQQARLERLVREVYRVKAALLESPVRYQERVARDQFRKEVEDVETKIGCLLDTAKLECLPKPPKILTRNDFDINISAIVIAEETSKSQFWVVRKAHASRFKVPIAIFLSVTNRQKKPTKIDLLYLEAKSPDGRWTDIRMADSLSPSQEFLKTMESTPLVLESKDGYGQMKGEYLLPSLYNRLVQPDDTVAGWIIAEYPKGIAYTEL